MCGVEIGVELEGVEPKGRQRNLQLCRRKNFFLYAVRSIAGWCKKLGIELEDFNVQFAFPAPFGPCVHMGKAVAGRRGRAVPLIESGNWDGQLCLYTSDHEPGNPEKILCEDIVHHELMHILDVRQGRSPSLYPYLLPGQGEWLDLFRHLWIDGHLEQLGLPHVPKEQRVRELASGLGGEKAETLTSAWWGKPMTMHDAVSPGLGAGLKLEQDCPLAVWYKNIRVLWGQHD